MDNGKSVFTKLRGLSKKDNNTSLNTLREDIKEGNPASVFKLPNDNFNHSVKHHEDIQEIGDELNSIERVFMNEHAMHLIDLLTGYVKDKNLSKTTRYFALEQVFRSSVTKEIFEKHLSEEECEIHTNRALDYLFACMTPNRILQATPCSCSNLEDH
tara:strand:+ start:309 stop:779 length:471 start_codon:yes stop_codon:yes gene_type:complete